MSRHFKLEKTYRKESFVRPNDRTPDILAAVEGEPPHDRLPGLWAYATMVWEQTCDLFGGSLDLIALEFTSKKNHRLLGDWVRNLEILVRHIVFVAAIAMKLKPAKPNAGPWGVGPFRRTWWDDPLTWKVSFRMLPRKRGAGVRRMRRRQDDDDSVFRSPSKRTRPMALRLEALRRVLSDHPAHVARFARQLARIKAFNATANEPRELSLPHWDFHPDRRTSGHHAVARGMSILQPLAEDWFARLEPG